MKHLQFGHSFEIMYYHRITNYFLGKKNLKTELKV